MSENRRYSMKELYKQDKLAYNKKAEPTKMVRSKNTVNTDSLSRITAKGDGKYVTTYVNGIKYKKLI